MPTLHQYFNPKMETIPRDELRMLQEKRIQFQIMHAYANSTLIRKRFEKAKIHPSDIKTIEDFQRKVPPMEKDTVRDEREKTEDPYGGVLGVPPTTSLVVGRSTGTTGIPTFIPFTSEDISRIAEQWARALYMVGLRRGDRYALKALFFHMWPKPHEKGAELLGLQTLELEIIDVELNLNMLKYFKPKAFWTGTTPFIAITNILKSKGLKPKEFIPSLEVVLEGGDYLVSSAYKELKDFWDPVPIHEMWGAGDPPYVAVNCKPGGLSHLWEDYNFIEFLDPDTKEVVGLGEVGEKTVTPLWVLAQPYIRWMTEDMEKPEWDKCECGRTHVRVLYLSRRGHTLYVKKKKK